MLKCLSIIMLLASAIFPLNAVAASSVAIFDYDIRTDPSTSTARYIESLLLEQDATLSISQFSGEENPATAMKIMRQLDSGNYQLIIAITSDALAAAQHTVKKTPVLFTNANNPMFLGFRTLKANGGNISGASYYVPIEKQLEFYRKIQPEMLKVGFLFDAKSQAKRIEVVETRNACRQQYLEYAIELVNEPEQLPQKVARLIEADVDAIVATSSGKIYNNIDKILSVCTKNAIPIYSFNKKGVPLGAVAALASDYNKMAKDLVVPMAMGVLRNERNIGEMPVEFLGEHLIFINEEQAVKLSMTIPPEILSVNQFYP